MPFIYEDWLTLSPMNCAELHEHWETTTAQAGPAYVFFIILLLFHVSQNNNSCSIFSMSVFHDYILQELPQFWHVQIFLYTILFDVVDTDVDCVLYLCFLGKSTLPKNQTANL